MNGPAADADRHIAESVVALPHGTSVSAISQRRRVWVRRISLVGVTSSSLLLIYGLAEDSSLARNCGGLLVLIFVAIHLFAD